MADTPIKSEKSINKSTFLDSMLQNSRIACILILDNKGTIMEMSRGVMETFGYSQEDLLGKNFSILFTEEDLKLNKPGKELQHALKHGFGIDNNYLVHKNGTDIWCQGESLFVHDKEEKYFVKYIYDINKQKQLEQSLNNSKMFVESILETIDEPLIVLDQELKVLMANKSFNNCFNPEEEEMKNRSFFEIKEEVWNIQKLRDILEKILPESLEVKNFQIDFNFPEGKRFFHLNAQQVIEEGRKMPKVLIAFHDITEEKMIRESLNEKNQKLDKVNKDLDMFVYSASHDLKSPVNNLEALLTALEEHPKCNGETRELIRMMKESVHRLSNTINDLAIIAKAEQEGKELVLLEFEKLFEEVRFNLKEQIEQAGASVSTDFSNAPVIHFSKKNLRSVLHNLLSNAIKYRSPDRKPQIHICTEKTDGLILLEVRDNGIGIKEEDKDKVFALYQRIHHNIEGSGVGMNIVKKIVDNNGGRIEIDSTPEEGTAFRIYLKA